MEDIARVVVGEGKFYVLKKFRGARRDRVDFRSRKETLRGRAYRFTLWFNIITGREVFCVCVSGLFFFLGLNRSLEFSVFIYVCGLVVRFFCRG